MLNFMCIKMLITASTVGADRCTTNELLRLLMVARLNGYRPVLADVCQTSGPRFEPLLANQSLVQQRIEGPAKFATFCAAVWIVVIVARPHRRPGTGPTFGKHFVDALLSGSIRL